MEADLGGRSSEPTDWNSCRTYGHGEGGESSVKYNDLLLLYEKTQCFKTENVVFLGRFLFDYFVVAEGCGQADRTRAEGLCKGGGSG